MNFAPSAAQAETGSTDTSGSRQRRRDLAICIVVAHTRQLDLVPVYPRLLRVPYARVAPATQGWTIVPILAETAPPVDKVHYASPGECFRE